MIVECFSCGREVPMTLEQMAADDTCPRCGQRASIPMSPEDIAAALDRIAPHH